MQNTYLIVPDFFESAESLRKAFEQHFKQPEHHGELHQIWNYWYVPGSYTYLRTTPQKLLPEPLMQSFMERLGLWAKETLGLDEVSYPWLSLYVDGCGQNIHNDSKAGQTGYVFSLTRWNTRNFLGGETILYKEGKYWETDRIKSAGASTAFYDTVPAQFNQLLVFDDRVIHGVHPLQGTMDPFEGRLVLHGHMKANNIIVKGGLHKERILTALSNTLESLRKLTEEYSSWFHGFMTLQSAILPNGDVASVNTLYDRVLPISSGTPNLEAFKENLKKLLQQVKYPESKESTYVTVPVLLK